MKSTIVSLAVLVATACSSASDPPEDCPSDLGMDWGAPPFDAFVPEECTLDPEAD